MREKEEVDKQITYLAKEWEPKHIMEFRNLQKYFIIKSKEN